MNKCLSSPASTNAQTSPNHHAPKPNKEYLKSITRGNLNVPTTQIGREKGNKRTGRHMLSRPD